MFSFFRRSRPKISPRDAAWRRLAVRLELSDEAARAPRLCELLDLPLDTEVGPVYGLELDLAKSSLFFDYRERRSGPTGQVDALVSGCTLSCHEPIAGMSLRASQKLHPVLESLGASSIGGVVVELDDADCNDDFNDRVSLFARDVAAARRLLTPATRKALLGVLYTRGLEPTLLLGERDLVATNRTSTAEPTDLVALEALAVNLLTLYTTLSRPDTSPETVDEPVDDPSADPSKELE
ncbi:MAG: hypothetical protein U5L04_08870 [Trueperaceae bacterium]|nr:hypothetical protein [Trueperaceae bacterium]